MPGARTRPHRLTPFRCLFALLLTPSGWIAVPALAQGPAARRTGEWLVDVARDYAMSPAVTGRNEDAEIILSYLDAAARVDPSHADSYLWQYDMLTALGRQREAVLALSNYADLQPADISARIKTIQLRLELLQTLELRKAFCEEGLAQPKLHPLVRAELSYQLAVMHFAQLVDDQGDAALAEALVAFPDHAGARVLRQERSRALEGGPTPIDGVLMSLSLNPLQSDLVWGVAQQLDAAGLHAEAIEWFERALEQFRFIDESYKVPAAMRIEVSAAYLSAGRLAEAMQSCQQAVDVEPRDVNARLMLLHIARELSREDLAIEQIASIRLVYDDLEPMIEAARAGRSAAEIALFYAWYDPQPAKASRWIELAETYEPGLSLTQIASGFLALAEGRVDDAIKFLTPFAAESQMAALGLGDALLAAGRQDEAVPVVRAAAERLRTGPAYALLAKRLASMGQSVDAAPTAAAMKRSLEEFDQAVFELARNPTAAVSIEAWMVNAAPAFGEPWRCRVRMKNVSGRPIHLGRNGLLSPQVLVSVDVTGDRTASFPGFLWFSADWNPVLMPDESVEVTQTIDVGPLRTFLDSCPQARLEASVFLIVDAVPDASGAWVTARAGRALAPIRVTRAALSSDENGLNRLFAGLDDVDAMTRIASGCALVALAAEHQVAQAQPTSYPRAPFNAERVMAAVLGRIQRDELPHVRARLLDSLRVYVLGPRELPIVAGSLSDRSWLVRLMAVTTLGGQQGRAFGPVLNGIGSNDPDRLLRQYCKAFGGTLSTQIPSGNPSDNTPGAGLDPAPHAGGALQP